MSVLWIPFPGALRLATHAARAGPATDIVHVASSIGRGSVSWLEFVDYAAVIHGQTVMPLLVGLTGVKTDCQCTGSGSDEEQELSDA